MNIKFFILIILAFFLTSCPEYQIPKSKKNNKIYFSSNGFALIYNDHLFETKVIDKRINNDDLVVLHSSLKRNTSIKITNPLNSKTVNVKVYKKSKYPKLFNIVISKKISNLLDLDENNPYIEILEVKKNKTFIAKEGSIFDEEKKVAEKAPVSDIVMDDLSKETKIIKKSAKKDSNFIILISDFYYLESAENLKKELEKKINLINISIKKINVNKYRLFVGPFKNFNALKTTYISLNNLNFDQLNVLKLK